MDAALAAEPPLPLGPTGSSEQSTSQSSTSCSRSSRVIEFEHSAEEVFDPYHSSTDTNSQVSASASVDNISFLSLNVDSPYHEQKNGSITIPPPLLTDLSTTEYDAGSELSAYDLMTNGNDCIEKSAHCKSKYKMVPSSKSSSLGKNQPHHVFSLQTVDPDELLQRLEEIGSPMVGVRGARGTRVSLPEPLTFTARHPSLIKDSPRSIGLERREQQPCRFKQNVEYFSTP